ncbi:Uncharacterised protein [Mycobacteroides abscessus]|nr:Uncharacterised protein [Mycobacteroides abscessus]
MRPDEGDARGLGAGPHVPVVDGHRQVPARSGQVLDQIPQRGAGAVVEPIAYGIHAAGQLRQMHVIGDRPVRPLRRHQFGGVPEGRRRGARCRPGWGGVCRRTRRRCPRRGTGRRGRMLRLIVGAAAAAHDHTHHHRDGGGTAPDRHVGALAGWNVPLTSASSSARMTWTTALINARWVNACGKLPR